MTGNDAYVPETARQRRVVAALAAKGRTVTDLEWSPVGGMVEMQGREGGWFVFYRPGPDGWQDGFVGGFSLADVLAQIEELPDAGA